MARPRGGWIGRAVCGAAVAALLFLARAGDAHAAPPQKGFAVGRRPAPAPAPVDTRPQRWYGWQILTADVAIVGLVIAATSGDGEPEPAANILGLLYPTASPFIHLAHDQSGKALGSLGLRLALPLLGGLIGFAAHECDLLGPGPCRAADVGAVAGVLAATAIDSAWLAWEPVPEPTAPERTRRPRARRARAEPALRLRPVVGIAAQRAWFGLAGSL